jgi:hypothetical protein
MIEETRLQKTKKQAYIDLESLREEHPDMWTNPEKHLELEEWRIRYRFWSEISDIEIKEFKRRLKDMEALAGFLSDKDA